MRGVRGGCVVSRVGPSGWNCTLFTPRCDIIVADDYHGSINWRGRAKHCAGCAGRVLAVRGVGRARWLSDIIEISTPDNARVQGPRENNADLTSLSAVAWGRSAYVWRENARARLASTLAAGIRLGHGGERCPHRVAPARCKQGIVTQCDTCTASIGALRRGGAGSENCSLF